MKKLIALLLAFSIFACRQDSPESDWLPLWNGADLTGWHTYLATPYNLETDSLGHPIEPFGVDNDPLEVITVVKTDQDTAIRISGVAWGMIYTDASFENYHLKLKVKWGEAMHPPRENGPRDSGLLYHGFGEPGGADYWMHSQELQIQEGDMGDYWPVGAVEIDIPSVRHEDGPYYIYREDAPRRTYYKAEILPTATPDSLAKRRVLKAFDAEKPHGQWNDVELIALGDSSIHIVNGEVVMRLYNSRRSDQTPLTAGKILLQSEGAEVFYKDIYMRAIDEVPERYR